MEEVSYWFDSGEGMPRALQQDLTIQEPSISLREAWDRRNQLDPIDTRSLHMNFNSERDVINWRWGKDGSYSAIFIYSILCVLEAKLDGLFFTFGAPKCLLRQNCSHT